MIPSRLKLTGFLSYRDPVEVDFSTFKLACISGHNGAGKSSLLDAITWVLFGQARKRDETLINSASEAAEVVFTFRYEANSYRIQRLLARGKNKVLEFQIQDGERWRPLTEATSQATQARIESVLRLDYETFVNASFFLQGKADQFTQQRPTDRKSILTSILGLEQWESYRERTVELRKVLEREVDRIEGRLAEINSEMGEEPARRARLKELETELARLQESRKTQETLKASIDQAVGALKRQREQVEKLHAQIQRGENESGRLAARQTERENERMQYARVAEQAESVESAYQNWQLTRTELEKWNALAEKFREQEKVRQEPLARIGAEQARLEQEQAGLYHQEKQVLERQAQLVQLEDELAGVKKRLAELEEKLKVRARLEQAQAIIARFREQAKLREAPLAEINAEKARLEQELKTLEKQRETVETQQAALNKLQAELNDAQTQVSHFEIQLVLRKTIEQGIQNKKERQYMVKSGNERLKLEMETLNERIKKLESTEGALCPLCGQPLSADERKKLIDNLGTEGKEKGNEFRKNKAELEGIAWEMAASEKEISGFGRAEKDHLFHVTMATKINERMEANLLSIAEWDRQAGPRLVEIQQTLTGESFSPHTRQHLGRINRELEAIGKALGVKVSGQKSIFEPVEEKVLEIENELKSLKTFEEGRNAENTRATQLTEQINTLRASAAEWQARGKPRLAEIGSTLETSSFAQPERARLAEIDLHLKSLGYDAGAHDTIRQAEQAGRASESALRALQAAQAALVPLERELLDIGAQLEAKYSELELLKKDHENARGLLDDLQTNTPDVDEAERALLDARERENIVTREVGVAQQNVAVLKTQRERKAAQEMEREQLAQKIKNHKTLERAFGKDGVPAMLIEQALPQIEEKANELLDRLSNGSMHVRFVTQAEYKNKKREDLKETLDIQISDEAGTRDYEMFSGGEAFRVNFAIRLALSEVLARRTGARLQTLVIDEGFGSQDAEGRQRLIEAINQVQGDFEKILIITHLDELKEAFPNRIEVEKTIRGSSVRVM